MVDRSTKASIDEALHVLLHLKTSNEVSAAATLGQRPPASRRLLSHVHEQSDASSPSKAPAVTVDAPVTVRQAARVLGVSVSSIQKNIGRGAPCIRPGQPGRGRGALIDIGDYCRWRAGGFQADDGRVMRVASEVAFEIFRSHGGITGTMRRHSARLLVLFYERFHHAVTGNEIDVLPSEMQTLFHVSLSSGQSTTRRRPE